ncbi:MAG: homocysteine S-methyltransferase family protein, partial [Verrucomicrobiota bacterium]
TFSGTTIAQSEFFRKDPREDGGRKDPDFYQEVIEAQDLRDLVWEQNVESVRVCRQWADNVGTDQGRQCFVAGAIGPMTIGLHQMVDAENPEFRSATFDQVKFDYSHQIRALMEAGCHLLMVETIFDALNAKAALVAVQEVFAEREEELPIIISAAVGMGGETMTSAQRVEACWNAVSHVKPLAVGLNCAIGPEIMRPFIQELGQIADTYVSCYPNAGLPDPLKPTGFSYDGEEMVDHLQGFLDDKLVNLLGGCCGNTPEYIGLYSDIAKRAEPRGLPSPDAAMRLSGSEAYNHTAEKQFLMIGERTNVAGSPKFRKLIKEDKLEEALEVARQQVENGANIIDINFDEGMLDGIEAMTHFLKLVASEPDISKVPIMIDSSKW